MKNLLPLFVFFPFFSFGQSCNYSGEKLDAQKICDLYKGNSFSTNLDAEKALDRILNVTGMSKRFVIHECNNIDNCSAIIYNGIRYIIYDKYFMKEIANNLNSWSNISILAHEIGHHVNGHTLLSSNSLAEKRQMEIEADEYSGFVMKKLGASLYQAQSAVNKVASNGDDTYKTHPSKNKRLAAIQKGYMNADRTNDISNNINLVEEYFYKAFNAPRNKLYFYMFLQFLQQYPFLLALQPQKWSWN